VAPSVRILAGHGVDDESDAVLVDALQRGEVRAELVAWNRFGPGVDGTLRRLLGPGPDLEDLMQEVFFRFFRRIGTLREPAAVRGFLTGICLHVVQGEIARRRRRRMLSLTVASEANEATSRAPDVDAREAVSRYYRLLDQLSSRDRSLFVSRTIEGLSLESVASLHSVSVSTAQRRIRRAGKRIAVLVRHDPILMNLVTGAVR
jgi:RNA polymerase sigma-70 factor (ECF subfamily)